MSSHSNSYNYTFPVVCPYRLKKFLSSSSEAADGLSILLPNTRTGHALSCSSVNNASSSAFDSGNLDLSLASTRNTIASTAGK